MDMILQTLSIEPQGAFSYLLDVNRKQVAVTVEHTYDVEGGGQMVKLPAGTYDCKRGMHTLNGHYWFETFEITGVVGRTGILFHPGNTELDSKGCVCTGEAFNHLYGLKDVTNSQETFQKFMLLQTGVENFKLTVENR